MTARVASEQVAVDVLRVLPSRRSAPTHPGLEGLQHQRGRRHRRHRRQLINRGSVPTRRAFAEPSVDRGKESRENGTSVTSRHASRGAAKFGGLSIGIAWCAAWSRAVVSVRGQRPPARESGGQPAVQPSQSQSSASMTSATTQGRAPNRAPRAKGRRKCLITRPAVNSAARHAVGTARRRPSTGRRSTQLARHGRKDSARPDPVHPASAASGQSPRLTTRLGHGGLVRRVDELGGVVVDVRDPDDDGDGALLLRGLDRAEELANGSHKLVPQKVRFKQGGKRGSLSRHATAHLEDDVRQVGRVPVQRVQQLQSLAVQDEHGRALGEDQVQGDVSEGVPHDGQIGRAGQLVDFCKTTLYIITNTA